MTTPFDMQHGRLVVLCGLPGSGKTTTAQRIADETGGVRFCPDDWIAALEVDLFDEPFRARIEVLQWRLAQELLRLGQTVILEWGVWTKLERDTLREAARAMGARVELHYLDVPLDELWRRLDARNREHPPATGIISRENLVQWSAFFEAPDAEELAQFDPA